MANTAISPDYFWYELSKEELSHIYEGISKKNREAWEVMRMNVFFSIQPHLNKNASKTLTPQKLIPLPWDKEEKTERPTRDRKAIMERMAKKKKTDKVAKL